MSFYEAVKEELKLYIKDKWLLSSVLIVPFVLFVIISNIFGKGLVVDLPVGIVDFDKSSYSRDIARYIDGSDKLHVKSLYSDENRALKALKNNEIYAYISIPKDFEANSKKGLNPIISSFYNTQFILIGRIIDSALKMTLWTFDAKLSVGKTLFKGDTQIKQAYNESIAFTQQITPLYNMEFSYAKFLLPAIIPCVWQILLIATIVLNIIAQQRETGLKNWLKIGFAKAFLSKIFLHVVIMFSWCVGFILYFYEFLGWNMNGSYTYLLFGGFLCTLASSAVGFAIYFSSYNPTVALSTTASYTASCLAFVGVTFPVSDMSPFAQVWSSLLPITHYINIQISQANYGANPFTTINDIYFLLGFNLLFAIPILSIRLKKGDI